jgi:hypothetical protein
MALRHATQRASALRPLRLVALAARRSTSPVVCATVEERDRAASLLPRTEECGGGGPPRASAVVEGAQSRECRNETKGCRAAAACR